MSEQVTAALADLIAQGAEFWVEGDRLRFRAPGGILSAGIRAYLSANKEQIIAALRERASKTKNILPLSWNQRSLWLTHQLAPDSAAYNTAFCARIGSEVQVQALRDAFQALVDRHAALRTLYTLQDDQPVQHVYGYREVAFTQVSVVDMDAADLQRLVADTYQQPFDLEHGPILRVHLFTRAANEHVLLLNVHHIALDGWSMWLLLDELGKWYAANAAGAALSLPRPGADYASFVEWQSEMLDGPQGEEHWKYWQRQLAGELPTLDLPTDYPHPLAPTYRGGIQNFVLDTQLTHKLKDLAKAEGTTLYTVLLAVYLLLLHRYSGQDEVLVGSPVFGRSQAEFADVVGDFINMLVLRSAYTDTLTFTAFLAGVRQTVLAAIEHQDFPFALLVERLNARSDAGRSPLFQVSFDVQRTRQSGELDPLFIPGADKTRVNLGGLLLELYDMPQQLGQFDLGLHIFEAAETLLGSWKYSSDLFHGATIQRINGHYKALLESVVADPQQQLAALSLLTEAERQQTLVAWNATERAYPQDLCVHQLFEQQAARTPGAPAVRFNNNQLTYEQLNARANQLAHYLRAQGVGAGAMVGVHVDRSFDMVVALLGVLKAGAAYVPMDPGFPRERLAYMIEDAGIALIITQAALEGELPPHQAAVLRLDTDWPAVSQLADHNLASEVKGDQLAYVIFTSGSTGRPKGVQVTHGGLTNFLLSMQAEPGLTADDVLLAVTTISFDIAALELYLPLISGAQVVILSRDAAWDGRLIAEALAKCGATVMQATPVTWQMLLESGWTGRPALKILCGGEALPASLAQRLLEQGHTLWNMYGPTETTIWSTVAQVESAAGIISIGRPIANTTVYVLDASLQPVPVGLTGTLYIGGAGVARGYIQRPDLTAERFIANPFGPGQIYNTGDIARWLPDGRLECLGRVDHQVKIRGFRIELGEIEAALENLPGVEKAVAIAREDTPNDKQLAAYVLAQDRAAGLDTNALREKLKSVLPAYMLPAAVMALDVFPLTPNGKIDRRALPQPRPSRAAARQVMAPQTATEAKLAELWRSLLGVETVSVSDNFFDLGGHSLQAVRLVAKIEEQTGCRLTPALLRFQTLRQLATALDAAAGTAAAPVADSVQLAEVDAPVDEREVPFFFGPDGALFGMYYPAQTAEPGAEGVVICSPWGQEYIRAHRACHQLGLRLAKAGVPALRFDYFGTGDSAGDDADCTLSRCLEDIARAAAELRALAGVSDVALVGLRLGGTLAALTDTARLRATRLVLWDPVVNGESYLAELAVWHQRNLWHYLGGIEKHTSHDALEVLGFAISDALRAELAETDLLRAEHKPAERILLVERELTEATGFLRARLAQQGAELDYRLIDGPQMWTENPDKALVPHQTLEAIVSWLRGV